MPPEGFLSQWATSKSRTTSGATLQRMSLVCGYMTKISKVVLVLKWGIPEKCESFGWHAIIQYDHTGMCVEHPDMVRQRVELCSEHSVMVRRGYLPS